jgi:putative tryptophan/tyrosine transport system substrate-binding protein
MKKSWFLLILIIFIITSCQKGTEFSDKVAILKYTSHPALDELEQGFVNKLEMLIKSTDKKVKIEKQNANKDTLLAKQMAGVMARGDAKLILAIATPAAQAFLNLPSKIPILYGAVADPEGAGLIPSDQFTGIQNASPKIINTAIDFIVNYLVDVRKIGTLYNPSEQNSVFVQTIIKDYCKKNNIELIQKPINDPRFISSIVIELINQKVNVIYSANDNTVNSSIATIVSICSSKKIPLVLGDLSTLKDGAVLAIGLEYKKMGEDLANIAFGILNGQSVKDYPPRDPPDPAIWLNKNVMEGIGLKIKNYSDFMKKIQNIIEIK